LSEDGSTIVTDTNDGAAFFGLTEGSWLQQAEVKEYVDCEPGGESGDGPGNCVSVSADGDVALIGDGLFIRSNGAWTESHVFSGEQDRALSPSGSYVLAGAELYERSESRLLSLQQLAPKKRSEDTLNKEFGAFVSLSADGETAAIGGRSGVWLFADPPSQSEEA